MLPRAAYPEEVGVSSAQLLAFLDAAVERKLEFHSIQIVRHGKVAARLAWKPYAADLPHMLFSLSKSFCSCAAGFAVAEGRLTYDAKVADVLSDKLPANPDPRLKDVTLAHLLSMGSGLDPRSDMTPDMGRDWAKRALSFPIVHAPGTHFHYNTMGTYLVSAMVQRAVGETVRDYLVPRLFSRIGIPTPAWDTCPLGVSCGGLGLHLSCDDIAAFGQLLLQDGVWEGECVLPEEWVHGATRKQIDNAADDPASDWQQGYGWQFWRCRENCFRGDGMFGQMCYVVPDRDAVIAVTAGIPDMKPEMDLVHDLLLPALLPDGAAREGDGAARTALSERANRLGYPPPTDDGSGMPPEGLWVREDGHGIRFTLDENDVLSARLFDGETEGDACRYGRAKPVSGKLRVFAPAAPKEKARAAWGFERGVLRLWMRMPEAPIWRMDEIRRVPEGLRVTTWGAGAASGEETFVYRKKTEE